MYRVLYLGAQDSPPVDYRFIHIPSRHVRYSPKLVEGPFSELLVYGFLGSSLPTSNTER
jgi:hypothetical protein